MALERHPISARYPDITGPGWDDFLDNLTEYGCNGRKIVLYEGKVLDGWQLYRGCVELGIKYKTFNLPKDVDPEQFVETANEHRRHESHVVMESRAAERRIRVAARRKAGESIRMIAENEGITPSNVQRDLSGVSGDTPANGKVTGKDGKTYKAKKPKKPPVVPPDAGDAWEVPPDETREVPRDAKGFTVPAKLRDLFAGDFFDSAIEALAVWKKHLSHNLRLYPYLLSADADNAIDTLLHCLRNAKPHLVHQKCHGKGCSECRASGYLTQWRALELEEQP